MDLSDRSRQARQITLVGSIKNIFLATIKIIFGVLGHSHALVADGIHSLSDLLIDGLVLVASHFGSKAADFEHPYGHGRIETAATVLLAFILSLAGIGIIFDAGIELYGQRFPIKPNFYVLIVALISILVNEFLYFRTRQVGQRIKSKLLIANAWHHRSDSVTSLVVFFGAGVAWLGYPLLDPIAAIIVGLMIIKMAWEFGWSSIQELIDTGLEEKMLGEIKQCIGKVPGVEAIHQLRTRSVGGSIFLDVHILVDPSISVSEGHFIGQQVHFCLLKEIPEVVDVTLHVDPEDDEAVAPSRDLPTRAEIVTLLNKRWQDLIPQESIDKVVLHYLGGKIYVELKIPLALLQGNSSNAQLQSELKQRITDLTQIAGIEIVFK